jgi:hypothetical protein
VNGIRSDNPKDSFAQVKLMGMYYKNKGQRACPELVEVEQGHNYIDFCQSPALLLEDSLIDRTSLNPSFQIGNHPKGMAMKESTKSRGHSLLLEMIEYMGHNIWSYDFYSQLKNIEQDEGKNGSIKWGSSDVRRFNDDLVVAMLLAYIAMTQVGSTLPVMRDGVDDKVFETVMVPVFDAPGSLTFHYEERQVELYADQ